ncbi:MAG: DUF6082 family protein [Streptosporangiaceae bacterium]|jgi:hypothetical protein
MKELQPTNVRPAARSHGWRVKLLRKSGLGVVFLLVNLAVLWLILISPLFLQQIEKIKGISWSNLANVGQTYGAASAILSAIALIGIALSFTLQLRQSRTERIRLVRDRRIQLLETVIDAPHLYGPVIGMSEEVTADQERRNLFTSMWVDYSRMGYELGILTEAMLRGEILPGLFRNEAGRQWWNAASHTWTEDQMLTRRDRRFIRIVKEEYVVAQARGKKADADPSAQQAPDDGSHGRDVMKKRGWTIPAGVVAGVVIGVAAKFAHSCATKNRGA